MDNSNKPNKFSIYQLREGLDQFDILLHLEETLHKAKSLASIMTVAEDAFDEWTDGTTDSYGEAMRSLLEESVFLLNNLTTSFAQKSRS